MYSLGNDTSCSAYFYTTKLETSSPNYHNYATASVGDLKLYKMHFFDWKKVLLDSYVASHNNSIIFINELKRMKDTLSHGYGLC